MGILLADQTVTPAPAPAQMIWPGLSSIVWQGWDMIPYDLAGPGALGSGVVLGRRVRGLHFGELEAYAQESPAVDGASYQGYRAKPREVFLSIRVYRHDSGTQAWLEYDSQFWRSMLPAIPGVRGPGRLTVVQPNGTTRWIELYPSHRGEVEHEMDPSLNGWQIYGQYLTANRPFWVGDTVKSAPFSQGGSSGFFGGSAGGMGPPFVIGPGTTFGAATIDNPGDEPAWPRWRVYGPFTQATIGVPGQQSQIIDTVGAGEWRDIDTHPLAVTVRDQTGAVRIPSRIEGAEFSQIMPGMSRPLAVSMVGTGRIEASLDPLYHRAW